MFVFGHSGITLAAALLLNAAFTKNYPLSTVNELGEQGERSPTMPAYQNSSSVGIPSWPASLANNIDIRLLLIGSVLPDIIDKPVGWFFFRDIFNSGRIFCHTLLFLILITLGGLYLYRSRKKTELLVLSFGTLTHVVLDRMWLTPRTILWPLYGFSFQKTSITYWTWDMLYALLTDPPVWVWIPELVGLAVIIWFASILVWKGKLCAFVRNGRV